MSEEGPSMLYNLVRYFNSRGLTVVSRETLVELQRQENMRRLRATRGKAEAGETMSSQLTKREREVVALLPGGLTNREIGQRLGISPRTVNQHLRHIYRKWNVQSRTEAAVLVTAHKLYNEVLHHDWPPIQIMADACPACGGTDYICYHCATGENP